MIRHNIKETYRRCKVGHVKRFARCVMLTWKESQLDKGVILSYRRIELDHQELHTTLNEKKKNFDHQGLKVGCNETKEPDHQRCNINMMKLKKTY